MTHDPTSITDLTDDLGRRLAYHAYLNSPGAKPISFEQFATPTRYRGCWSEANNSEWAGFAGGSYATEREAIDAARREAPCCRGGVSVWACEVTDVTQRAGRKEGSARSAAGSRTGRG